MRRLIGLLLAGSLLAVTPRVWAGAHKRGRIRVRRGYIDAHFAVSPDGKRVAFVHVISDADVRLSVAAIQGGRIIKKIPIARYTTMPASLRWTSDGRFVVLSWSLGKAKNWALIDWRAGTVKTFPNVRDLRCRPRKSRCVVYTQGRRRGITVHSVTVLNYPGLRKKSLYRVVTDERGRLTNPVMDLLYFRNDYLDVVGKIRGRYDKARDIRLPDREAIYDVATRKVVRERPIKDAIGWEKMRLFRKKHSALDPLLIVDDQGGKPQMVLVTPTNERRLVSVPEPMERFRASSLVQMFLGASPYFSLIVDPQNPLALKRRQSDKEVFYLFQVHNGRARILVQIPSEGRYQAWSVGRGMVGLMALHKNWGLGATGLDFYSFR